MSPFNDLFWASALEGASAVSELGGQTLIGGVAMSFRLSQNGLFLRLKCAKASTPHSCEKAR